MKNREEYARIVAASRAIYRELYPDVDNKHFKEEMTTEIENWLYEGDVQDYGDTAALATEFNRYWNGEIRP